MFITKIDKKIPLLEKKFKKFFEIFGSASSELKNKIKKKKLNGRIQKVFFHQKNFHKFDPKNLSMTQELPSNFFINSKCSKKFTL